MATVLAIKEATHGDLTNQHINHIQRELLYRLRKDSFWDKFCSHTSIPTGTDTVEWRKLNIPNITAADVTNLVEGITPEALTMTYVNFKVSCVDYGKYIGYTDKSKKYNFDDVESDAKKILGQSARDQAEYRKAAQYVAGTSTMSPANSSGSQFLDDLLKARIILKKNHIKPISGNKYGAIITPELAAKVLVTYKDAITHTSQKEALIEGYLGELGGFILYENADGPLYKSSTVCYALFIGKSEFGLPVQTVSFGDASVQIINHSLGEGTSVDAAGNVVSDALNQHGTVGYKVMGFCTRIVEDEAVIRAEYSVSAITQSVDDDDRFGYQGSATSNGTTITTATSNGTTITTE